MAIHKASPGGFFPLADSSPNRRMTSEQVTRMDRMIRMMMIQVISAVRISHFPFLFFSIQRPG